MRKPKKPKALKKPKVSASLKTWENYDRRATEREKAYNNKLKEWVDKHSKSGKEHKRKEAIIKKHSK